MPDSQSPLRLIQWGTPLLLPLHNFNEHILFGWLLLPRSHEGVSRKMDRCHQLSLLCIHPHEKVCKLLNDVIPPLQFTLIGPPRISERLAYFNSEHLTEAFFTNKSIIREFRDKGLQLRRIGAKTPSPVMQSRRNPGLSGKIGDFLEGRPSHRPVIRFLFNPGEDLDKSYPSGIDSARRSR